MQTRHTALLAVAAVLVTASWAPPAAAVAAEGDAMGGGAALFSAKTKAVSGFAVGSLAGLLLGGLGAKKKKPHEG